MQNIRQLSPAQSVMPAVPSTIGKPTAHEATWACSTCGIILPYQVKTGSAKGRWIRNRCACQVEEEQARDHDEISAATQRNFITKSFAWLGPKYSDLDLAEKTFDNFNRKAQPEAYLAALEFAEKMTGNLILHSPQFGTGKTHLLVAVCNRLRVKGIASHFVTAPKLFRAIQDRMDVKEPFQDIIFKAVTVPFLVIDDVDKVKASEWKEERYFEIIDERTKAGRPTGISTNKYDELKEYMGGAVCSRLKIGRIVVEMRPEDYRERL